MHKPILFTLAASLLTLSPTANAVSPRQGPAVVHAPRSIVVVRGGDDVNGCVASLLNDRWVLSPRSFVAGARRVRCLGDDATRTTVSIGASAYAVAEIVTRSTGDTRAESQARPAALADYALLRLASPVTTVTIAGRATSPVFLDWTSSPRFAQLRGWIDATVGGAPPQRAAFSIVGTWHGAHPHWSDEVIINADGTYHRGNGDPGHWTFDGRTLTLNWTNWSPELVVLQPDESFASTASTFTLRR